jgi:hypothetical protein
MNELIGGKSFSLIEFREGDPYSANFDIDYYYHYNITNYETIPFNFIVLSLILSVTKAGNYSDTSSVLGRWDITVNISGKDFPSWFEVERSGSRMLVGRFVGPVEVQDQYRR